MEIIALKSLKCLSHNAEVLLMLKSLRWNNIPKGKFVQVCLLGLLLVLSLAVLGPLLLEMAASYREERALFSLLKQCGAQLESVNVTGWARVNETRELNLDALVVDTAVALQADTAGSELEQWENAYARGVKLQGTWEGGNRVVVMAQSLELMPDQKATHIMVSMETGPARASLAKNKLRKALLSFSSEEHVALTYTGKINGALEQAELAARAESAMEVAGASIQEKTVKDNLVSITGQSAGLPAGLRYGDKEVNLNVALRSDQQEQATYVYVASPVIYTEY
jgi:hypothetical protein